MALRPITAQTASRFCALVIGPAGIGKTSLLHSICGETWNGSAWERRSEPQSVFVLSAESGLLCVRNLVAEGLVQGAEVDTIEDFIEAQRYCASQDFIQKGFRWVFIDSLTEISSRCVAAMERKYPSKADSFKMWGDYSRTMTDVVKAFRDMPHCNVVLTCLESLAKDEFGAARIEPDMAGTAIKSRLTSYFDEVLHMETVQDGQGSVHVVFNTRRPVGMAKDRSGKLSELEAPDLQAVQAKVLS